MRPNNGTVRKFRALVFGIALVLLSAGLTSCSSSADDGVSQLESSASPLPERIRPIEIAQTDIAFPAPFDQEWAQGTATRIVTLANGSGEVVAVLGGGDRVVGRDETSSAPEISGAPIVTSSHEINVESVLGVTPDLVLIDASSGPQEAIDSIRSAGITVVEVPEAWTIAEIAPKVEAIGSAIGAPVEAITYVAGLTAASEQMSLAPTPKVAFLYVRGTSAIYLLGGEGSGADSLIRESGGTDVGAQAELGPFTPLTAEEIVRLNPDVLLVMTKGLESVGGIDGLVELPGVAQTKAAATRAVIEVDDTLLLSFGPRTGDLINAMNEALTELNSP